MNERTDGLLTIAATEAELEVLRVVWDGVLEPDQLGSDTVESCVTKGLLDRASGPAVALTFVGRNTLWKEDRTPGLLVRRVFEINEHELRALRMARGGRCPLVRAVNVGEEPPNVADTVDGWLPMPNAVRDLMRAGWPRLEPPNETPGAVQNAVLTERGRTVLDSAHCATCTMPLGDQDYPDPQPRDACLPPSRCWQPVWSDGKVRQDHHVGGTIVTE